MVNMKKRVMAFILLILTISLFFLGVAKEDKLNVKTFYKIFDYFAKSSSEPI